MTCDSYRTWVDDFVDGTLEPSRRDALAGHVVTCAACSALVEDVRRIQQASRALGPLEPPALVWQRIEAATTREPGRAGVTTPAWRDWLVPHGFRGLAAAAGLALVVGSLTWTMSRLPRPTPSVQVTSSEVVPQFEMAQAAYHEAIDDLEQVADGTSSSVVTEPALAELRAGLSDLDTAILEAEATLAEAPDDPFSQEQLLTALGDKVAVLQDTVLQDTMARLDDAVLNADGLLVINP
jgi:anti-sigma factor RsiW